MALLPNLGRSILDGMDVEAVTGELQEMSRAAKARVAEPEAQPSPEPSTSSSSPSAQARSDVDARSDSISVVSYPGKDETTGSSDLGASTSSWVDQMSSDQVSHSSPEASSSASSHEQPQDSSPESNAPTDLSESFISNSSVSFGDIAVRNFVLFPHGPVLIEYNRLVRFQPRHRRRLSREVKQSYGRK